MKRFDEINCENISSFVYPKLYQPFRQQSLKKFVEISNFGIDEDEARVEHGNSKRKEDCEKASYFATKDCLVTNTMTHLFLHVMLIGIFGFGSTTEQNDSQINSLP